MEPRDKPVPDIGPGDALVRITTTTVCGTDVHIVKGEYPLADFCACALERKRIKEVLAMGRPS